MRLEDYLVFHSADDIRIQGTDVGIEHVLYQLMYRFESPEAIAARFPTMRVEQVYATITYYYHRQKDVEAYMRRWMERNEEHADRQAVCVRHCVVQSMAASMVQAA